MVKKEPALHEYVLLIVLVILTGISLLRVLHSAGSFTSFISGVGF